MPRKAARQTPQGVPLPDTWRRNWTASSAIGTRSPVSVQRFEPAFHCAVALSGQSNQPRRAFLPTNGPTRRRGWRFQTELSKGARAVKTVNSKRWQEADRRGGGGRAKSRRDGGIKRR